MISRALDDIQEPDLQGLCRNDVAEGRTLDYKLKLPGEGREDKAEFVADVTSFANSQGGDLVYGVKDEKGVAVGVPGIDPPDLDKAILRLESLLRDCIDPRLVGARLHWAPRGEGGGYLIIRVPPSPSAPHRNTIDNRFYGRNSRGKYPMDTHELRVAFTAAEGLPGRLRKLHADVFTSAAPFRLFPVPQAHMSIIPVSALREAWAIEPTPEHALAPVRPAGDMRVLQTLEGVLLHTSPDPTLFPDYPDAFIRTWALTHRGGHAHVGWSIGGERELRKGQISKLVNVNAFEQDVVGMARAAMARLQQFGLEGPWAVIITLTGLEEYELLVTADNYSTPAWRDGARLPEVLLDVLNEETLTPLLKSAWLLFGMVRPEARKVPPG